MSTPFKKRRGLIYSVLNNPSKNLADVNELQAQESESFGKKEFILSLNKFDEWKSKENSEVQSFFNHLQDYVKKIEDKIIGLYLLGSYATHDYTTWSDVDLLMILKEETLKEKKSLLECKKSIEKINKILLRIDPLQHHGVFILPEKELHNYSEAFFPISFLEKGICIMGKEKIKFNMK